MSDIEMHKINLPDNKSISFKISDGIDSESKTDSKEDVNDEFKVEEGDEDKIEEDFKDVKDEINSLDNSDFGVMETEDDMTEIDPLVSKNFVIIKKIGRGTFSNVFLARPLRDNNKEKFYAIKCITPTSCPERIINEIKLMKACKDNDNVMTITACYRKDGHILIIMPYFLNSPISTYLRFMSIEEIACYIYNLLFALAGVHEMDIIHRDVKPTNFLYDRQVGKYSLVDFGLAHKSPTISCSTNPLLPILSLSTPDILKRRRIIQNPYDDPPPLYETIEVNQKSIRVYNMNFKTGPDPKPSKSTNSVITTPTRSNRNAKNTPVTPRSNTIITRNSHNSPKVNTINTRKTPTTPKNNTIFTRNTPNSPRMNTINTRKIPTTPKNTMNTRNVNTTPKSTSITSRNMPTTPKSSIITRCNSNTPKSSFMSRNSPSAPKSPPPIDDSQKMRKLVRSQSSTQLTRLSRCNTPNKNLNKESQNVNEDKINKHPINRLSMRNSPSEDIISKKQNIENQGIKSVLKRSYDDPVKKELICVCKKKLQICGICTNRPHEKAQRAGTPGFRAPEVLMRYQYQTYAIDIWSVGSIFLSLMSGRYPFFKASDDKASLTDFMEIVGSERMVRATSKIPGKYMTINPAIESTDLKVVCEGVRKIDKLMPLHSFDKKSEELPGCIKKIIASRIPTKATNEKTRPARTRSSHKLTAPTVASEIFIAADETMMNNAYALLDGLLDPDFTTRLTAKQAMNHSFFSSIKC